MYIGGSRTLGAKNFEETVKLTKGVIFFVRIEKMNQICTQGIQLKVNGKILPTCKTNKRSEKYLKSSIE